MAYVYFEVECMTSVILDIVRGCVFLAISIGIHIWHIPTVLMKIICAGQAFTRIIRYI